MQKDHLETSLLLVFESLEKAPMKPDEWQKVCAAMDEIRKGLGLSDELGIQATHWPFPAALI